MKFSTFLFGFAYVQLVLGGESSEDRDITLDDFEAKLNSLERIKNELLNKFHLYPSKLKDIPENGIEIKEEADFDIEARDITQVRKDALNEIEAIANEGWNVNSYIGSSIGYYMDKITRLYDKLKAYGSERKAMVEVEIDQIEKEVRQKADKMNSDECVYGCIQRIKRLRMKAIGNEYHANFGAPIQELAYTGSKEQLNELLDWQYVYHYAYDDFMDAHDTKVKEIKTSNDRRRIGTLVDRFRNDTSEFIAVCRSLLPRLEKVSIKYQDLMMPYVDTLNGVCQKVVEESVKPFNDCLNEDPFRKFLN